MIFITAASLSCRGRAVNMLLYGLRQQAVTNHMVFRGVVVDLVQKMFRKVPVGISFRECGNYYMTKVTYVTTIKRLSILFSIAELRFIFSRISCTLFYCGTARNHAIKFSPVREILFSGERQRKSI
jgi:hypothetical protein